MTPRAIALTLLLGAPVAALLLFGPRGTHAIPAGRTIIRYWDKWTGVEGAAVQRVVDRFNATDGFRHNLWVDYNALGDVDKRMLIATAGGDPPDLAGLFDRFVPQYADQGALLPLDDAIREHGIDLDTLKPIWLDICRYSDRLYALPSTPYTIALYYNRRLFREAGLDPDRPPQTTAELNAWARKLTRKESERITQLGFTVSPAMLGWWHWVWPCFFNMEFWDGERFALDTQPGRATYEWIMDYRSAVGNASVLQFEANCGAIESAQNPFLNERLAMIFQGPWLANWARVYAPNLDYGVAAFPSVTAERKNVFASTDVFVIPRGSKHPREAMAFLAFLMRPENLEELCAAHGKGSPFRTPGPMFYRNHPNPKIREFDELAASPHAFGYPKMPMWSEAWTEMLYLLETVLRGARPPKEAIEMTQRKVDQIVAEWQRARERRARIMMIGDSANTPVGASRVRPRRRRRLRREPDKRPNTGILAGDVAASNRNPRARELAGRVARSEFAGRKHAA